MSSDFFWQERVCNQCGGLSEQYVFEATLDSWFTCPYCGYSESSVLVIEPQDSEICEYEGSQRWERIDGELYCVRTKKGLGVAYFPEGSGGRSKLVRLDQPPTDEMVEEFRQWAIRKGFRSHECYLTRWDDRIKGVQVLFGAIPAKEEMAVFLIDKRKLPRGNHANFRDHAVGWGFSRN